MISVVELKMFNSYDEYKDYIKQQEELRRTSGIYIVVAKDNEVIYIGGYYNLRQRLNQHDVIRNHYNEIRYIIISTCNNVWKVEKAIRDRYRPRYCKEYNTKAYKEIYKDNLYTYIKTSKHILISECNNIATEVAQQIRRSLI